MNTPELQAPNVARIEGVMASCVERGLMRRRSRAQRWSKRCSARFQGKNSERHAEERQLRGEFALLSTFMLDAASGEPAIGG
jgi:hypothetical protein